MASVEPKDAVTAALSLAALVVSVSVAVRTRHYNRASLSATSRNNYMNALLNINREILGHPELWAVYDPQWQPPGCDSPSEIARRRAFIWYHINLFELFYTDYHRDISHDFDDRTQWAAWHAYVRSFLKKSSEAQAIVRDGADMALLSRAFREYLVCCLPDVDAPK
jgi:hypothetical protein